MQEISLFVFFNPPLRDLTNMHQVSEVLVVVKSIANYKLVWNFKSHIIWNVAGAEGGSLPEKTGNLHTLGLVPQHKINCYSYKH